MMIEEEVFGYHNNSNPEPDFFDAKTELKFTPIKKNNNGTFSAKERLVLNIINYMEEYKKDFYSSSFWMKNQRLFILFYLWEINLEQKDYRVVMSLLHEYPEEDLLIIIQDWQKIVEKIRNGKAHELSESDTLYLGACQKGKNRHSLRKQPFSSVLAMQRAFSLKNSYMTQLVRMKYMEVDSEKIVKKSELENKSFEEIIYARLERFIGLSQNDLKIRFNIQSTAKNINDMLLSRMLGIKGRISNTSEFIKANIITKTIRVEANGRVVESMSFPYFLYKDMYNEVWENSTLRNHFETEKYMFVIFKKQNDEYIFSGVMFWNMPVTILDSKVKEVWEKTKNVIITGDIIKSISEKGIVHTNFPTSTKSYPIVHVRPHGTNKNDKCALPVKEIHYGYLEFTKHCFWLTNKFVEEIIKSRL
jgi:DNA mismatch repair protein MutH